MMPRVATPVLIAALLTACGGGEVASVPAVSRDSAGIAITEYPAEAWDAAPAWSLSPQPLAVIGGDPDDAELDLSTSQFAALLDDGQVLLATFKPMQILLFSADGKSSTPIGREGEGPGEYRFLGRLDALGPDTLSAFELLSRRSVLFSRDGSSLGNFQFPLNAGTQVPPMPVGRLANGTWVFQLVNPLADMPSDAGDVFRADSPMLAWHVGDEIMDTLFVVPGPLSARSSVNVGETEMPIARPLAYGAQSSSAISGNTIWTTTGDHFVISARDSSGALQREVRMARPDRPVTDADRTRYKDKLREALERVRSMVGAPPALFESEIAKIDGTQFAEMQPAISQLVADRSGRIWATGGAVGVDSVLTYVVFSSVGELIGRVVLPSGLMMGASEDRVLMRREDDETGLVRFEVWGVQPVCKDCPTAN